jgi:transcriptional regulator with XRE-family HTH domain
MPLDIYLKLYLRNGILVAASYCLPQFMATRRLLNYLRTYRKHSGLSQSDISFLIRLKDKSELSRYERGGRQPSLRTALACQEVFGRPVSELFAGLHDSVTRDARGQMMKLKTRLQKKAPAMRRETLIAQKFQWISQRLLEMPRLITSLVV